MPTKEDLFAVMSARVDVVVLRVLRSCTAEQLCSGLLASKTARARFMQELPSELKAGEDVALTLKETRTPGPVSPEPVDVLWYDRFFIAANKPTGLLVHGDGTGADTLTARVQAGICHAAAQQDWPFVPVAQAINRLDVDTSGIVLFSQTAEFQPAFDALVADHRLLSKRYLAIVEGEFSSEPFTIDAPIARNRHDARRMRVGKTGKSAQTRVSCVSRRNGLSLVVCELLTGRRHQIRVHLAHVGYPIVGDVLYGRSHAAGLMLHAYEVEFTHPLTGDHIALRTALPARFASLFPDVVSV